MAEYIPKYQTSKCSPEEAYADFRSGLDTQDIATKYGIHQSLASLLVHDGRGIFKSREQGSPAI